MTASPHQPHQGPKLKVSSKFQLVIAAAKRSKQLASEAKAKGLSPNSLAMVKSKSVKPTTLALEELKAGKVRYGWRQGLSSKIAESQEESPDSEKENPDSYLESLESEGIEISESKC